MKITFTILVAAFLNISMLHAQKLKPNDMIAANHTVYKTQSSHSSMVIKNANNKLDHQTPGSEAENMDFKFIDQNSLINCFKTVFNTERLQQILPEHRVFINFYINSTGKVLEVSFLLNQNTIITSTELEYLEDQIKKNVTFKLQKQRLNENKFYVVGLSVKLDKVIDGTL